MKGIMITGDNDQDTEKRYAAMNALNALSTAAIENLVKVSKHPKAVDMIENKHEKLIKALNSPLSGLFG